MSKFKYILLKILAAVIAFVLIASISAFVFLHFYIIPKYNENAIMQNREEMTTGDIVDFAKYFTDKQFVNNLKNFDTSTAKDMLNIMVELKEESGDNTDSPNTWDITLTAPIENLSQNTNPPKTSKPTAPTNQNTQKIESSIPDSKQGAYERIMAAADKKEISAGLSIISKIDISKINSLRSQGKNRELKEYIKNCLSSSEISTALSLYNKYKHLL